MRRRVITMMGICGNEFLFGLLYSVYIQVSGKSL